MYSALRSSESIAKTNEVDPGVDLVLGMLPLAPSASQSVFAEGKLHDWMVGCSWLSPTRLDFR